MSYIEPKINWSSTDGVTDDDFNRIEGNIKAIHDKGPSVQLPLSYGMNSVVKSTSDISAAPAFTFTGKDITNRVGRDGNCEDVSKWTPSSAVISVDNTTKVFGQGALKVVSTVASGVFNAKSNLFPIDATKNYCLSGYIKNTSVSSLYILLENQSIGIGATATVTQVGETAFSRYFIKIPSSVLTSNNSTGIRINLRCVSTAVGQIAHFDGIMIEEITQAEYEDSAFVPSPYVDSYACLTNPYIEIRHDNLIINGDCEDGVVGWLPGASTTVTMDVGSNTIKVSQPSGIGDATQIINVKKNTTYYFDGNGIVGTSSASLQIYNAYTGIAILNGYKQSFNTGDCDKIFVRLRVQNGYAYFGKIMLIEGSIAPTEYKSGRLERFVIEGNFSSSDTFTFADGLVTGYKHIKDKTLFGKNYNWLFHGAYAGVKNIRLDNAINDSCRDTRIYLTKGVKYDGSILNIGDSSISNNLELYYIDNLHSRIKIGIANIDSGWTDSLNPTPEEIQAFMNGWEARWTDTRYCTWVSKVDGSVPKGSIQAVVSAATNTTTITVSSGGTQFVSGDRLHILSADGLSVTNATVTGTPTETSIPVTSAANVSSGCIAVRVDTTANGRPNLNYCKNNIALGYEGYRIHYHLATPEKIIDANVHVRGNIPLIEKGDNYILVDSGIVLGEINNPWNDTVSYQLNNNVLGATQLRNRVETILQIYKNNIPNINDWTLSTDSGSYGKERRLITIASGLFDVSAIYSVDYKILDTQAPQIGSINCTYEYDVINALNSLADIINNKQMHDSTLDKLSDLGMYEKVVFTSANYFPTWAINGSNQFVISFGLSIVPKKLPPIITIKNFKAVKKGLDITSKLAVNNAKCIGSNLFFSMLLLDDTLRAEIAANGMYATFEAILDCFNNL